MKDLHELPSQHSSVEYYTEANDDALGRLEMRLDGLAERLDRERDASDIQHEATQRDLALRAIGGHPPVPALRSERRHIWPGDTRFDARTRQSAFAGELLRPTHDAQPVNGAHLEPRKSGQNFTDTLMPSRVTRARQPITGKNVTAERRRGWRSTKLALAAGGAAAALVVSHPVASVDSRPVRVEPVEQSQALPDISRHDATRIFPRLPATSSRRETKPQPVPAAQPKTRTYTVTFNEGDTLWSANKDLLHQAGLKQTGTAISRLSTQMLKETKADSRALHKGSTVQIVVDAAGRIISSHADLR